jgi:hypothetical protein
MISRGIEVPIGGLDCKRMSCYCYLKVGDAIHGEKTMMKRKTKYLMFD